MKIYAIKQDIQDFKLANCSQTTAMPIAGPAGLRNDLSQVDPLEQLAFFKRHDL